MVDMPIISVLATATWFVLRSMVYLLDISSAILIVLMVLINAWYQSVGRQRRNPLLNPSTLKQSISFQIKMSRMGLMIHFRILATKMILIPFSPSMISYTILYSLGKRYQFFNVRIVRLSKLKSSPVLPSSTKSRRCYWSVLERIKLLMS